MTRHREQVFGSDTSLSLTGMRPRPERLSYIVGDVHGSLDKLQDLLEIISRDRANRPADIVFLGDYVDRGTDSAGVLRLLLQLEQSSDGSVTCLAGNHDRMMLGFLDDPDSRTGRWLSVGGVNTLASFGALSDPYLQGNGLEDTAATLADAMGPQLVDWLRRRPLWWRSGNVIAVHALTDPAVSMDDQLERTLLWARPDETLAPRRDGCWVVHGHTLVQHPTVRQAHIAIDTGACHGNPLSAVVLEADEIRFLQAH